MHWQKRSLLYKHISKLTRKCYWINVIWKHQEQLFKSNAAQQTLPTSLSPLICIDPQTQCSTVRYVGPVTVICIWNKPCLVSRWFTDLKWMEADPPHEQRYACHTKTVFTLGSMVMLEAHPDISSKHRTLHFSLWAVCIVMCVQPWTCMCVIFLYVCSAFYVHVHQDVDLPVS